VSETSSFMWSCPSCGRRVPRRAAVCHCGMTQDRAQELAALERPARAPASDGGRPGLPRDVSVLLGGAALVLVAGLVWAALAPAPRNATTPVLGRIDPGPPDAAALLADEARPGARPPFKLPWWK
jgi:hypothetical protein